MYSTLFCPVKIGASSTTMGSGSTSISATVTSSFSLLFLLMISFITLKMERSTRDCIGLLLSSLV